MMFTSIENNEKMKSCMILCDHRLYQNTLIITYGTLHTYCELMNHPQQTCELAITVLFLHQHILFFLNKLPPGSQSSVWQICCSVVNLTTNYHLFTEFSTIAIFFLHQGTRGTYYHFFPQNTEDLGTCFHTLLSHHSWH